MKASVVEDNDSNYGRQQPSLGLRSSRSKFGSQPNLFMIDEAASATEMYRNDFDASSQVNFIYNFKDFGTHIEINQE